MPWQDDKKVFDIHMGEAEWYSWASLETHQDSNALTALAKVFGGSFATSFGKKTKLSYVIKTRLRVDAGHTLPISPGRKREVLEGDRKLLSCEAEERNGFRRSRKYHVFNQSKSTILLLVGNLRSERYDVIHPSTILVQVLHRSIVLYKYRLPILSSYVVWYVYVLWYQSYLVVPYIPYFSLPSTYAGEGNRFQKKF
jgi:hypothetical protein